MATPPFFGPQFVVNTTTAGHQFTPAVAGLAGGKFVAVWEDIAFQSNDHGPIRAQLYNADGSKFGGEFITNENVLAGTETLQPTVTALADGRFVVAWSDFTGGDNSEALAKARIFNADGTAAGGEFNLSPMIATGQNLPTLTALADGGFAASWTLDGDIRGRTFDANGAPRGSEFIVDEGASLESDSAVAGLAGGNLVVVWQDDGLDASETDGSGSHIRARFVTADGTLLGGEFIVNTTTANSQSKPAVTALPDGGFAVVWTHEFSPTDHDVHARLYDANGFPKGPDFPIDNTSNNFETAPSIVALPDGNLFVAWTDSGGGGESDGSLSHVRAKIISGVTGGFLSDEFIVNSTVVDAQQNPAVTVLADGRVMVAWEDQSNFFNPDTSADATDVRAQIIDPRTAAVNLTGGNAVDDWVGTDFADTMDGKGGNDRMAGGDGNDTYVVDSAGDIVIEIAGEGKDTIKSTVSKTLVATVENLTLLGTANLNGTGNEQANVIIGNAGANILNGAFNTDTMIGLGGDDSYHVDNAGDSVTETVGQGTDSVLASVSYQLKAGVHVEQLLTANAAGTSAINLTGNEFANLVVGNVGANILNGGVGIDTLRGLSGDDAYHIDNAADVIQETAGGGADRALASTSYQLKAGVHVEQLITNSAVGTSAINLFGNEFANSITGNAGSNIINGKAGADTLRGLGGNDFFIFDTALGAGNIDTLADFNVAADTVRLENSIFTGLANGVLAASAFHIGAAAADALDRIIYNSTTGALSFDADGIGGAAAVQFADLSANLAMTNGDFFVV
jgi:Ca2+-binding RTX toxin-like protein